MTERRPLTAGLAIVPPGVDDADAVKSFITQERKADPQAAGKATVEQKAELPSKANKTTTPAVTSHAEELRSPKKRKSRKSVVPVGLIPVTVRLKPEIAAALKRASLERQLAGEEVYTQQDLVEEALEPWLRGEGCL